MASPGAANGSQKKPSKRQQNARKCAHHAPFFGAASLPLPIATLADPDPNPNPCLAARRKTWRDLGDNNRVKLVQQALGATLWTHQFGSNSDDRVWAVATSRDGGSIAVGGDTMGVLPGELRAGDSSWDGYVKLLNASDGTSLWTHQFGTHRGDFVRAMAVSPVTGSIVVGGSTYGTFPGAADNIGGRDPYVIMLSAIDGAQIWSCQFGGDSNGYIHALAADPVSGNIAVGGVTQSSGEYDAFVMLLSATDGAVLWAQQFGSSADDNLNAVAFHPAGNIVVGRDSVVMLLNSTDGAELWTHQFGSSDEESLQAMAVDPTTGMLAFGGDTAGTVPGQQSNRGGDDGFVFMYDGCSTARFELSTAEPETTTWPAPSGAPTTWNPTPSTPTAANPTIAVQIAPPPTEVTTSDATISTRATSEPTMATSALTAPAPARSTSAVSPSRIFTSVAPTRVRSLTTAGLDRHACDDGSHGCDATEFGLCLALLAPNTGGYRCGCAVGHQCSDGDCTTVGHACLRIPDDPTAGPTEVTPQSGGDGDGDSDFQLPIVVGVSALTLLAIVLIIVSITLCKRKTHRPPDPSTAVVNNSVFDQAVQSFGQPGYQAIDDVTGGAPADDHTYEAVLDHTYEAVLEQHGTGSTYEVGVKMAAKDQRGATINPTYATAAERPTYQGSHDTVEFIVPDQLYDPTGHATHSRGRGHDGGGVRAQDPGQGAFAPTYEQPVSGYETINYAGVAGVVIGDTSA